MMVSLPTHICVTRPQWVKNDLDKGLTHWGQGQNGGYFTDSIFKRIFMNEKVQSFIRIYHNKSALVQIMAWCWSGNKALSEPIGDKPLSEQWWFISLMHIWITRPQWECLTTWSHYLNQYWLIVGKTLGTISQHIFSLNITLILVIKGI